PEKPSSAETSYTFAGWTPEISDVTADVIYKATYSSTTNSYTIVFVNGGETLQSSDIAYGVIPVYAGVTPTKASSVQYMYNFKGWSPEISAVTSDAIYTAVFDSTLVRYYVQFLNGENVLQADTLEYGILPSYNAAIPTKENSQAYSYSFKGWTPEISAVTSDAVYKAVFDSVTIPVLSSSSSAESSSSAVSSSSIFSSSSEEKVIPALVTNCSIEENRLLVSIQPASDGSTWRLQMNVFDALGNKVSVGEEVSGVEMSYVFSLPSIAASEYAQTYYAILALDGKNEQACPSTPSWEVPALELPPMSSEAVSSSSESSSSTESSSSESSSSSELSSSSEIEIPVSSSSIEESSSSVEVSSSSEESSSSEIEISSSSSEEISDISSSSEMLPESSSSCSDENNCVEPVSSSSESLDYIGSKLHSTLALSLNGRTLQVYGAESATIRLFDLQGVPRFAKETIRGVVSLDNLPAGAYIIQVRAGKNTISRRLVLH
ncbi:MAG: T9SS type A sorting domain-containing protein, partial [Fibrobacteraceae bacterium]|nr:T9SS type A sorting domain-containing protein [Fibrobacteraceae bacterium]